MYIIRCECTSASQCETGQCERGRCVGTQVEGVVGIDVRYDDFHDEVIRRTRSGCQGNSRYVSEVAIRNYVMYV